MCLSIAGTGPVTCNMDTVPLSEKDRAVETALWRASVDDELSIFSEGVGAFCLALALVLQSTETNVRQR